MPDAPPRSNPTYLQLLHALCDGAVTVTEFVAAEITSKPDTTPLLTYDAVISKFLVLTGIVRRAIVVSRYIQTLPAPVEEREGRLMQALDQVFAFFAAHKMTIGEYKAAMDAELAGNDEDEDELDDVDELETVEEVETVEELERLEVEDAAEADVPGRPPAALVAELCRDFGIVIYKLPAEWLAPVPSELRLLCARAAAAALRPTGRDTRRADRRRGRVTGTAPAAPPPPAYRPLRRSS